MVEVKNLKKYYDGRKTEIFGKASVVKALDDISFEIKKGETPIDILMNLVVVKDRELESLVQLLLILNF